MPKLIGSRKHLCSSAPLQKKEQDKRQRRDFSLPKPVN